MDQATHSKIVSFLWGIADDVLRDLFKRGKYPDVILPMCVLRRLDAVLEPTKQAVLNTVQMLDAAGITEQRDVLCAAAGQAFYNTSKFTLRDLRARSSQQQLKLDFDDYLDGFSPNVQDILDNFKFRNQIPTLSKADALGTLIEKFLDPEINLSPDPVLHGDGSVKHRAMDNHAMGTVFEEFGMRDPRFKTAHAGDTDFSLVTRSSDGQMLFLANMDGKMSHNTPLGSRIAEVHNGSSLFTGDAGQGESNIRRWLIENDWLEAIVALPLNMFYNTGIATYIWVLTNRKPEHRRGKVKLIDATQWFKPLRKNLGKKNCEFSEDDIKRICDTYLRFEEAPQSKLFRNAAFGYWKIAVERPLRFHSQMTRKAIESLRFASGDEAVRAEIFGEFGDTIFDDFDSLRTALEKRLSGWGGTEEEAGDEEDAVPKSAISEKRKKRLLDAQTWRRDARLVETASASRSELGEGLFEDHNLFRQRVAEAVDRLGLNLNASELKLILRATSWRAETASPVIAKIHKPGKQQPDALHGRYEQKVEGKRRIVEFEPDTDLRDTEQVPLLEPGGIEAFFRREVLPHVPDAWIDPDATKIGYEISFTRYFYQPKPMRSLEEIRTDILAIQKESEGLVDQIIVGQVGRGTLWVRPIATRPSERSSDGAPE